MRTFLSSTALTTIARWFAILLMASCLKPAPTTFIGDEDGGKTPTDRIPNILKQDLSNTNIINPTGLQLEVEVVSGNEHTKKNGAHFIAVTADKGIPEWLVIATKKDASNINFRGVLMDGTPYLEGKLSAVSEAHGMGIAARYRYKATYDETKQLNYTQQVIVKVRDTAYCRGLVQKMQMDGELTDDEKVNGIMPTVTADTTTEDCENPSYTFNFDQTVAINLAILNDETTHIQQQLIDRDAKIRNHCMKMLLASRAMQAAGSFGAFDIATVDKTNKDGNTIKDSEGNAEQVADWKNWGNILKWGVQAAYQIYSIYTSVQLHKEVGGDIDCGQYGLDPQQTQLVNDNAGKVRRR
ncbi:MAG: hypothetical protein OYH77_02640 [Pseudomonadota bacterium]|nr:hypothetical protein [Pseudomonadota bacterium]